jgi:molybdate transport system regulatory protein
MQISARNRIETRIVSVEKGAVNAMIVLRAPKGAHISAIVTLESVEALGLVPEMVVTTFFKASHVLVATGGMPNISARNKLPGKVETVIQGAVNAELLIRLEGGDLLTAIITNEALNELEIREGGDVIAVIKASDVMIAN